MKTENSLDRRAVHYVALKQRALGIYRVLNVLSYVVVVVGALNLIDTFASHANDISVGSFVIADAGAHAALTAVGFGVLQTGAVLCRFIYVRALDELPDEEDADWVD